MINATNQVSARVQRSKMPNEDEREQALHHAARLRGLSLVRAGDTFALAVYTAATLDEIAAFLATDAPPNVDDRRVEDNRRADLRAMLRAERALIAELEAEKRKTNAQHCDHATTAAALAEIRRRIVEIQDAKRQDAKRTEALSVGATRPHRSIDR
jgi:hypothetical protein